MPFAAALKYLAGYPDQLVHPIRDLLADGRLGGLLVDKYPEAHAVRDDAALYAYVSALKARHLRNAGPLSKVAFDGKLQTIHNALGTHTSVSRVQGGKLRTKREIRVATLFREAPPDFLRMIVVHELAHLKERQHDKAFYQLCSRMEPDYHQLEFDVRVWLCWQEAGGRALWAAGQMP
ncbi:M48 family metallopeptidase [Zoogloea sp.]|uniref:M48 metallopeptidase family protein n=1 Tax=Zoogloea sp. TaxID=49181 RepID=UPI0035AF97BF